MQSVRTHIAHKRVSAVVPAPCGTWAVAVVAALDEPSQKYRRQLWRVDLAGQADPLPLTRGEQESHTPCFRHDGALAFLSSRPADKDADPEAAGAVQVWAFPESGGEPVPVTDEPLGVTDFRCATDADVLALWTTRLPGVAESAWRETVRTRAKQGPTGLHYRSMPVRFWDHWRPDPRPILVVYDGSERRILTPDADTEFEHLSWDLAPDGAFVVATWHRLNADRQHDADVVRIAVADGAVDRLLTGDRVSHGALFLSPGGTRLLAGRWARKDGHYPFCQAGVLDLGTGIWTQHAGDWDLEGQPAGWQTERFALLTAADHGVGAVYRLDTHTGALHRATSVGAWAGLHGVGERVVGLRSDLLHPPEVHVLEPDGSVGCPGAFAPDGSLAERVAWTSHQTTAPDGASVQWFQVRPRDAVGPLPGIIWVHGGPISSWQDTWHWRWNSALFALEGYALCLPNPRGSTGFGHAFVQGIWGNAWGAECYDDVQACADAFAAQDDVQTERVALMGGSFGGYMTNQVGGTTDRYACLVSHAGLFDFTAFYGGTDMPAFWGWQLGCNPYSDREAFERWSPARNLPEWTTPTLVVHGEKDYRVPIQEALALFEGLQLHGVESELLVFPDEGHWIQRPQNILAWHRAIYTFLGRYLQPG